MDTVLIEIKDDRAYQFLHGLEELEVIKVINGEVKNNPKKNASAFRGALQLTEEEHNDFQKYADEIRNEWEDRM